MTCEQCKKNPARIAAKISIWPNGVKLKNLCWKCFDSFHDHQRRETPAARESDWGFGFGWHG